jgi:hypothetical protein
MITNKRRSVSNRLFKSIWRLASPIFRIRRKKMFLDKLDVKPHTKIIDLGGNWLFWEDVSIPLEITIVNLPDSIIKNVNSKSIHSYKIVEGDACHLPQYEDSSFDIAFSNSVIEHVGDIENQTRFSNEVRRLAPKYWIQTPSIWFPVEAHNGMPLWWFYPRSLKNFFIRRWERKYPAWADMIKTTTVLRYSELQQLFPDSTILFERIIGITKSYYVFRD